MKLRMGWVAAPLAALFVMAAHGASTVETAKVEPSQSAAGANLQAYWLALDLYAVGVAGSDALMVIAAASLFALVQPTDASPKIVSLHPTVPLPNPTIDFATMIAKARALASEDARLQ